MFGLCRALGNMKNGGQNSWSNNPQFFYPWVSGKIVRGAKKTIGLKKIRKKLGQPKTPDMGVKVQTNPHICRFFDGEVAQWQSIGLISRGLRVQVPPSPLLSTHWLAI